MTPKHHPDQSTLLSYAAGSVTDSFSLLLAAHLESCFVCCETLERAESIGASLIEYLPQTNMSSNAFDNIWKSINLETHQESHIHKPQVECDIPSVLSPFFPGGLKDVKWGTLVPGIKHHLLQGVDSADGTVRLLRIAKGMNIPEHSHMGSELTLILQGSYTDETGRYTKGDISDTDSSVEHSPVVDSDEPCICLIATDNKLIFNNAISKYIQPLIGI